MRLFRTRTSLTITVVFAVAALGVLLSVPAPVSADSKELKKLKKHLGIAVQQEDQTRLRELIRELAEMEDPEAVLLMAKATAAVVSASFFDWGVEQLTELGSARLDPAVVEALSAKKKSPNEIVVLLVAGSKLEDETSEQWLLDALGHDHDLVRRAAMNGLRDRRSKAAVPKLIEILEAEGLDRNTVTFDARLVLISLTGRDYTSVEDWRNFWEGHKDTLDPANLGKEASGPTTVKLLDPEAPEFFGVEVVSQRVVFVVDISGSMQKFDQGGETGGRGSNWENRQRIRRLKNQLGQVVRSLSSAARFNIVAFNDETDPWQRKLVPANSGFKTKALKWIRRLEADRGTATGKALKKAFEDPNADTIILLTDGAPYTPEGTPDVLIPRVEELAKDLNRIRKVKIFTFGFEGDGEWPVGSKYARQRQQFDAEEMVRFLKRLAKAHGGEYTSID